MNFNICEECLCKGTRSEKSEDIVIKMYHVAQTDIIIIDFISDNKKCKLSICHPNSGYQIFSGDDVLHRSQLPPFPYLHIPTENFENIISQVGGRNKNFSYRHISMTMNFFMKHVAIHLKGELSQINCPYQMEHMLYDWNQT